MLTPSIDTVNRETSDGAAAFHRGTNNQAWYGGEESMRASRGPDHRRPNRVRPDCEQMDARVLLSTFGGSDYGHGATISMIDQQQVASRFTANNANRVGSALAGTTSSKREIAITSAESRAPDAARWLVAKALSSTQIDLAWTHVASANGYFVAEWTSGNWTLIDSAGNCNTSFKVNGLSPSTTYYFDVGAFNAAGTTWTSYRSVTTFQNEVVVNHPAAASRYSPVNGSLFGPNGPSYLEVEQGDVGDCWLLASLAEVAARAPSDIQNMFTYDGTAMEGRSLVGLYTVRFFNSAGTAEYVTVDTELPDGGALYDQPSNDVLWVALAEKAYAEANGAGFVTTSYRRSDSYNALNGGDPAWALQAITGMPASDFSINPSNVAAAWNAGELIVLTTNNPASSHIVASHAYAVVGYNASSSDPFEVYNPWGTTSSGQALGDSSVYGLFNTTADFLSRNFAWQCLGTEAAAGLDGGVNRSK